MPAPAITTWNRVEPRPATNDFISSLRAEIRDPVWLLARQRQTGEFRGEDTGSPAYVRLHVTTAAGVKKWMHTPTGASAPIERDFRAEDGPLEAQLLAEPFTPDLATRAELGETFLDLIDGTVTDPERAGRIRTAFAAAARPGALYALERPIVKAFDVLDAASERFFRVVAGRVPDGFKIATQKTVPPDLVSIADDVNRVFTALSDRIRAVFGSIAATDPPAWNPRRLEYRTSVKVGDNLAATLAAVPDQEGTYSWDSFDVEVPGDPLVGGATVVQTAVPGSVRFPGMPAPRFWDFEDGSLPLPDVQARTAELAKLVLVDLALISSIDWFTVPYLQDVGSLARVDALVVHDVFGNRTLVERAELPTLPPGPGRWTLFSIGQPGGPLAGFTMVPAAAGRFRQAGPILEEVRFARDEMANMAWGIERITESQIGEPRTGSARDAAADTATPPAPALTSTAPLKYQVESKVRSDWIPFLPVPSADRAAPALDLEKAAVARLRAGALAGVPALGKVLNPAGVAPSPYRLPEEEIARSGVTIQRAVYRSRWTDGRAYLWVSRRRLTGTGETQSGLRFDAALPVRSGT